VPAGRYLDLVGGRACENAVFSRGTKSKASAEREEKRGRNNMCGHQEEDNVLFTNVIASDTYADTYRKYKVIEGASLRV
jgi:hypothetical protein